MAKPKASRIKGKCMYCGQVFTKQGMRRHLSACAERRKAIARAETAKWPTETLYHLRVEEAWEGLYWLDLEMRGSRTLGDLDDYLRAIWLECCGHLSMFSTDFWKGDEIPMSWKISKAFGGPGSRLTHIYDFGTSSYLLIKVAGVRKGKPITRRPIVLMARNLPPVIGCIECGRPAKWLCMECVIERNVRATLCEEHRRSHPCEDYGFLPVVNSPRMGMCGYKGPAEPPY